MKRAGYNRASIRSSSKRDRDLCDHSFAKDGFLVGGKHLWVIDSTRGGAPAASFPPHPSKRSVVRMASRIGRPPATSSPRSRPTT